MKYVIFSFDDGRKDFYTNALPVLKKYNVTGVVNIIGNFVGSHAPKGFLSSNNEFMTLDDIKDSYEYGIEIGNHTMNHTNEISMVECFSVNDGKIDTAGYDFASPGSEVCNKNVAVYKKLVESGKLKYIRSGRQIKRDGYFHATIYVLLERIKSPMLFYLYQKRNLIDIKKNYDFYPSLAIDSFTNVKEVKYVVKKMKDNHAAIFMFHSILKKDDTGYGKDKYFNDIEMFDEVCRFCAENKDVQVITNRQLVEIQEKRLWK